MSLTRRLAANLARFPFMKRNPKMTLSFPEMILCIILLALHSKHASACSDSSSGGNDAAPSEPPHTGKDDGNNTRTDTDDFSDDELGKLPALPPTFNVIENQPFGIRPPPDDDFLDNSSSESSGATTATDSSGSNYEVNTDGGDDGTPSCSSKYPLANDVMQRGIGNCWVMASLAALARTRPKYIDKIMKRDPIGSAAPTSRLEKGLCLNIKHGDCVYACTILKNKDGKIDVEYIDEKGVTFKLENVDAEDLCVTQWQITLFRKIGEEPETFPVDDSISPKRWQLMQPVDDLKRIKGTGASIRHARGTGSIWPLLLEKAYAQLHGCTPDNENYERSLNGGWASEALMTLTNMPCKEFDPKCPLTTFSKLKGHFENKYPMTGTYNVHEWAICEIEGEDGDEDTQFVTVFDPRNVPRDTSFPTDPGWSARKLPSLLESTDITGLYRMPFHEFKGAFTRLSVCFYEDDWEREIVSDIVGDMKIGDPHALIIQSDINTDTEIQIAVFQRNRRKENIATDMPEDRLLYKYDLGRCVECTLSLERPDDDKIKDCDRPMSHREDAKSQRYSEKIGQRRRDDYFMVCNDNTELKKNREYKLHVNFWRPTVVPEVFTFQKGMLVHAFVNGEFYPCKILWVDEVNQRGKSYQYDVEWIGVRPTKEAKPYARFGRKQLRLPTVTHEKLGPLAENDFRNRAEETFEVVVFHKKDTKLEIEKGEKSPNYPRIVYGPMVERTKRINRKSRKAEREHIRPHVERRSSRKPPPPRVQHSRDSYEQELRGASKGAKHRAQQSKE